MALKIVLACILIAHGLVHLMGFANSWQLVPGMKLASKNALTMSSAAIRSLGILWLGSTTLIVVAVVLFLIHQSAFWIPGAIGLVLSQTLIIIDWQDAKWGTIANMILLVLIIFGAGKHFFDTNVNEDVTKITTQASGTFIVSPEKVEKLPPLVQRWLQQSGVVGKKFSSIATIRQAGMMRSDIKSSWMPFEAEQTFTFNPPAFVWRAGIKPNSWMSIVARDKFENGHGEMLIKAASLFAIANSKGEEIDQGTMLRFLAELCWFPQAATSDYIYWKQLDDHHVEVTMTSANLTVAGIYEFNDDAFPIGFEANRYGDFQGTYRKERWSIRTTGFQNFDGITIGNKSEVTWKLKEGDFTWLKLEVTDVKNEKK